MPLESRASPSSELTSATSSASTSIQAPLLQGRVLLLLLLLPNIPAESETGAIINLRSPTSLQRRPLRRPLDILVTLEVLFYRKRASEDSMLAHKRRKKRKRETGASMMSGSV